MNLKCLFLTYFRWYKDIFLSLLFQRNDSTLDFWKERFLVGLSFLFAKRVRTRLKNQFNGTIPYSSFTFGKLINEVISEGLPLCNDVHLKNQLKMKRIIGKKELGQFCNQFGTYTVPCTFNSQSS